MMGAVRLFRVYLDGAAERVESWPSRIVEAVETRLSNNVCTQATLCFVSNIDDCTI